MRLSLAQINSRVGDLEGNCRRIVAAVQEAGRQGGELVILPEMIVPGYPPRDLLLDRGFVQGVLEANRWLAGALREGPAALVGTVLPAPRATPGHPGLYNAALLLQGGRLRAWWAKRLLPAYDVFHEPRWFVPGPPRRPLAWRGRRLGVLVCEDMWDEGYPLHPPQSDLYLCLSASPYRVGVLARRLAQARRHGPTLVYVNAVGGQDELIFDGGSFALRRGSLVALLPRFEEAVETVDLDLAPERPEPEAGSQAELFAALVLGLGDFARKNGLGRAVLGLSGGVDSALAACIACRALGPHRVLGVALPSRYTDPRSTEAAAQLARRLGMGFRVIPIEPLHAAAESLLGELLQGTTAENLQARLRTLILMALVNHQGGFLLNTSNKTELSLGYGTLYGDLAGTLSVLGDLTKPQVMALARWHGAIPDFILERPPTAELCPDQVDPFDYPRVAPLVEALVQGEPLPGDAAEVERCRRLLHSSEHKRWQGGIILKVSERAFGTGRMLPVTRVERWRPPCSRAVTGSPRSEGLAPRPRAAGRAV